MNDKRKSIDDIAVQKDIKLHQITLLVSFEFIVEGTVAARSGLQRIEEVIDDLIKRHLIVEHDTDIVHVFHVDILASSILTELHQVTDIFLRSHDRRLNDRFLHIVDLSGVRHIRRVIHADALTGCRIDFINNGRRRGDQVEVKLSFESFLDDFIVKKS